MARLIDADALVAHFRRTKMDEVFPNWKELNPTTTAALIRLTTKYRAIVLSAPTVDAVPVVHGEWTIIEDDYEDVTILECSVCETSFRFDEYDGLLPQAQTYHYCPNCGADMR